MNRLSTAIGPLVVPTQLLFLVVGIAVAALVGRIVGRRHGIGIVSTLLDMLLAGVVAARIAFVTLWFDTYRIDPWTMLDLRDGGYSTWAGIVAAGALASWRALQQPVLRRPLALGLLAGAFGWLAVPGALRFGVAPTLAQIDDAVQLQQAGQPVRLAALASGRPVVLNLWATWCPPCRHEMPVLEAAQKRHAGISFVFANQGEDFATVQRYLDDAGLTLSQVVLDPDKSIGQRYGSVAVPTTLFYDAAGQLVDTHLGPLSPASLAGKLERLQAKADPQ